MRVVVAEDNLLVRTGLVALLDTFDDVSVVATCESFDTLIAAVDVHRPDVVITDVRMPPTFTDEGIKAATWCRTHHPTVGVVVLSQHVDAVYASALVAEGSNQRAYLLKQRVADPAHLLLALTAVANGDSYIDSLVVDALVAAQVKPASSPLHRLTGREIEVLSEVAKGASNATVAHKLFISERAVERHLNSILSKLDLTEAMDRNKRVAAVLLFLSQQHQPQPHQPQKNPGISM
jgi:DNA-binding NarL/FixJ family response regulator